MSKDLAIVTIVIGDKYERVASVSLPTVRAYADRVGAAMVVLRERAFPEYQFYWEKFQAATLLERHSRVLWVDADAIIRESAPSVFDQVPEGTFAAFDEGKYFTDRIREMEKDGPYYGIMTQRPIEERGFAYFNAGVMLFDRSHRELFLPPLNPKNEPMSEQTYTNLAVARQGCKFQDLGIRWNGLHSLRRPDDRKDLHIVHYAGWPKVPGWVDRLTDQMRKDISNC